ncbi:hypothetical protein [Burkholderia cenocepacia]|uniref:hypothetical protein n=1 Tax=Burkholderia cenocepacia TaxID=95486 RepID=UPI001B95DCC2|nr:hypothetical protein [Burkholderia cenocepacia]MBR8475805.1 hypothetical protein [Burkholderia cenocepacia]
MTTITINGYEQDCNCEHCGRPLKLGVVTDAKGTIGADCFVKLIARNTKRYSGNGKPGAERVREYALIVARGTADHHGLYGAWNTFELKA